MAASLRAAQEWKNHDRNGFRQYVLAGLLEDGTDITGKTLYIQDGSGALFTLNNALAPCLPC